MAQKWREADQAAGDNGREKNALGADPSFTDRETINKLIRQQLVMDSLNGTVYRRIPAGPPLPTLPAFRSLPEGFRPVSAEPKIVSGLPGILETGVRRGIGSARKSIAGLTELLGDLTSNQELTDRGHAAAADARLYMDGVKLQRPQIEGFGPRSIVNDVPELMADGIASITEKLTSMLLGGATGSPLIGGGVMIGQELGGNYSDDKADGLTPSRAGIHAGLKTVAGKLGGKVGEKIVSHKTVSRAGRNVANRLDIDPKMRKAIDRILSPIPGDVATTVTESGIDILPGLKLEKDDTSGSLPEQIGGTAATSFIKNVAEEGGDAARQKVLDSIRKGTRAGKK